MIRRPALVLGLALALLPAPRPLAAQEAVTVRADAEAGIGRMVFEWPAPVGYTARIDGRRLILRFERPFVASLAAVEEQLDRYVGRGAVIEDGRALVFRLKGHFGLRSSADGASIVVDLTEDAAAESAAAPAAAPPLRVRVGQHPGFDRVVFDWTANVGYRLSQEEGTLTVRFDRAAAPDFTAFRPDSLRYVGDPAVVPGKGPLEVRMALAEGSRTRHFRSNLSVVIDVLRPARRRAGPRSNPTPKALRRPSDAPLALAPPVVVTDVPVEVETDGAGARLRFGWSQPVAAAAFRRAGQLWLVFDRPVAVDLAALAIDGLVVGARQVEAAAATVLRLEPVAGVALTLEADGTAWIARLRPDGAPAVSAISVAPYPEREGGPGIRLSLADAGAPLRIRDPVVGDSFVVVPVGTAGLGMPSARRYPQFELPATTQGLVIVPYTEQLVVEADRQGVEIRSADGLSISLDVAVAAGARASGTDQDAGRLFDYAGWRRAGGDSFAVARQGLERAVMAATSARRNEARLDLARFYFARGLAADAVGPLAAIAREDPELAARPANRALRGAVRYLIGDGEGARADLFDPGFDRDPEIALWRAALERDGGAGIEAAKNFARGAERLRALPLVYRQRFGFAAAETALADGDVRQAGFFLDLVEEEARTPAARGMAGALRGRLLELAGRPDDALAAWQEVMAGEDRPSRVRAALGRVELLRRQGELSLDETITELDRLRFLWRGGDLEFALLHRLGRLYLEAGRFRQGLDTLKTVATYFPDHPGAEAVTKEMSDAFADLFLDDRANAIPAVSALALYDEYRELTPTGAKGEEMVRRLARRLVAVDLLGRATELLDQQMRFRLEGEGKARSGLELADIQLMRRDPDAALEALTASRVPELTATLVAARARTRAKALTALGRTAEALAALAGDDSLAAAALRFQAHWRAGDWAAAAGAIETLVGRLDAKDEARDELVLRWALALALARDEPGLAVLRRRFGPAMEAGPNGVAFRVVTTGIDRSPAALAEQAARLGDLRDVLTLLSNRPAAGETGQTRQSASL